MNKTQKIIQALEERSERQLENKELLIKYIEESLNINKLITFYNWECPPRFLDYDSKKRIFVNYCVDMDKIFKGEKIDEFTEIPRVVEMKNREIKILKFLDKLGLNYRFSKIIADTNAWYITQKSVEILGKEKIQKSFNQFKEQIDKIIKECYNKEIKTYFFTDLIKHTKKEYDFHVNEALNILKQNRKKIISDKIWKEELDYLGEHMGFNKSQKNEQIQFAEKVIATYCSEGMIFDKLSKTNDFSNCVWLNIEEAFDSSIETTNGLRIINGLERMPMIFLK